MRVSKRGEEYLSPERATIALRGTLVPLPIGVADPVAEELVAALAEERGEA